MWPLLHSIECLSFTKSCVFCSRGKWEITIKLNTHTFNIENSQNPLGNSLPIFISDDSLQWAYIMSRLVVIFLCCSSWFCWQLRSPLVCAVRQELEKQCQLWLMWQLQADAMLFATLKESSESATLSLFSLLYKNFDMLFGSHQRSWYSMWQSCCNLATSQCQNSYGIVQTWPSSL